MLLSTGYIIVVETDNMDSLANIRHISDIMGQKKV